MSGLLLDLRLALRGLSRRRVATLAAIVSLALGFAAQIAVLSCTNAVLWRALPVPRPDRAVNVYGYSKLIGGTTNIAYPHLEQLKGLDVFDAVAAFTRFRLQWDSGEGAENVNIELVSENYFDVLRPTLEVGRPPLENGEVLLGHNFWRDRFSKNRNVLGQTVLLSGERFIITGVMGHEYRGTLLDYLGNPKIWMTLRSQPKLAMLRGLVRNNDLRGDFAMNWFIGAARLKPGVRLDQAQQAVAAMDRHAAWPAGAAQRETRLFDASHANFYPGARERVERTLFLCISIGALLLFLGCVNAGLFLAGKAHGETRQTAVERALGARAVRVGRRRFAEAALLCGLALAAGTALAASWVDLLRAYPPPLASIVFEPAWDWRVWAWTLAATFLAIALASAAPVLVAIRAGGSPLQTMGSGPSRAARRVSEALVALQVAVACVILAATGLVLRTVLAAHRADLGFRAGGLVMADVELLTRVPDAEKRREGLLQVLMRLRESPEVQDAAISNLMPLTVFRIPSRIRDASGASVPVHSNGVSEDYFRTLDLKLERGRGFSTGKSAESEVVVNQTLARILHPSGDVLGQTLDVQDAEGRLRNRLSIVGVARDARYHTLWQERIPYFYTCVNAPGSLAVIVRSRSSTKQAWRAIRESVERAFPGILVSPPNTVRSQLAGLVQEQAYLGGFFGMLAAIALIVASGGLMASLFLMVSQRTREIGIRQALGATRATILRVIVTRGLAVASGGLLVGLAAAAYLEKLLRPLAPGTRAGDPWPLAVAFSLLLLVAFAAAMGPALRAARIQPWNAIRHPE